MRAKRHAWILVGLAGLVSPGAPSLDVQSRLLAPRSSTSKSGRLPDVLVEADRQAEILDSRKALSPIDGHQKRLSHRVYLHYFVPETKWLYVLTDFEGQYPTSPPEFLRVGSVLSGKLLGAKRPEQRYLLDRQGMWVPTFRPEAHYFIIHSGSPRIRQIEFATVERSTASAGDAAYNLSPSSQPPPKLVVAGETETKLAKSAGQALVPSRAYAIYNREESAWAYTWTTAAGKFPEPLELLYQGTILPGSYLGAKSPFQGYELTPDSRWVKTDEKEREYLTLPSQPHVMKRMTYVVPPVDPEERH